jgi:Zn ribbon nucleic-acid-binding protein
MKEVPIHYICPNCKERKEIVMVRQESVKTYACERCAVKSSVFYTYDTI